MCRVTVKIFCSRCDGSFSLRTGSPVVNERRSREGNGGEGREREPATAHCIFEFSPFHASIICQNNQIERANQICPGFRSVHTSVSVITIFTWVCVKLCDFVSISSKQKTPKQSQRGRKPAVTSQIEEFCRICKCSLKTKYGSLGTFVNVFKPCNRGKLQNVVLATSCFRAGIEFDKNNALSSRVCSACSRKLYSYCELFEFLSSEVNKP